MDLNAWYKQTQYRLAQYLIGTLTGYIIYTSRKSQLPRIVIFFGWLLSIGFLVSHVFYRLRPSHSVVGRILYDSLYREFWTASICWIVFACHQLKSGGVFRTFLSHRFWQPLSKVCLSTYLIHYIYELLTHLNRKEPTWVNIWWQIHINIADVIISFILGTIFYLIVEAPTVRLTRLLINHKKS